MKIAYTLLLSSLVLSPLTAYSAYELKDGHFIPQEEVATKSVQEHYSAAVDAFQKKKWDTLVQQATIVVRNFPDTPFAQESLFYLGVGYFNQKEYDLANEQFSIYLKKQITPKHFEEAIQYKFSIAEKFQKGARRHLMGWKSMPKWAPAREEALAIYDEVITALPHHDLGAKALYGKARLLLKDEDYKPCIETFQMLIRRFPKNALSAQSYLGIGEVYLTQCQNQYPDPDFLDLAEINLRKFKLDFPQDEQIEQAEKMFMQMQEIYATNLYETAQFFERTKKPHASIIYYTKVVTNYPNTKCAALSQRRLDKLQPKKNIEEEPVVSEVQAAPEQPVVSESVSDSSAHVGE